MTLTIDGKAVKAAEGETILDAALGSGISIPTLCYLKKINKIGACRICLVEVEGMDAPVAACTTPAKENMSVRTDTPELRAMRKMTLELICANHRMECTECPRGMNCELRNLCREYTVDDKAFGTGCREMITDDSSRHLIRDNSKCILCRRCVGACQSLQGISAIGVNFRSVKTNVGFGLPLSETDCIGCGQCINLCPTGALTVKDGTRSVWKAILREKSRMIALVSPYVCRQLGECFGDPIGTDSSGKVAAMLRNMGFHEVYQIGTGVSACPAWRRYLINHHPELADSLPAVGTPWEKAARDYRQRHLEEDVYISAFIPCVAAKLEDSGYLNAVISTRELADMWKRACVSSFTAVDIWGRLAGTDFDPSPDGWKEEAADSPVDGLAEAEMRLRAGTLDMRNVLACTGGCAMGGGSPNVPGSLLNTGAVSRLRDVKTSIQI